MAGNELVSEAGKALKDTVKSAVKDNASTLMSSLASNIWGIAKYALIAAAVYFGVNKLSGGKIFGDNEKPEPATPNGALPAPSGQSQTVTVKQESVPAGKKPEEVAAEMCTKKGIANPNVKLSDKD